jgi:hypothetical protein
MDHTGRSLELSGSRVAGDTPMSLGRTEATTADQPIRDEARRTYADVLRRSLRQVKTAHQELERRLRPDRHDRLRGGSDAPGGPRRHAVGHRAVRSRSCRSYTHVKVLDHPNSLATRSTKLRAMYTTISVPNDGHDDSESHKLALLTSSGSARRCPNEDRERHRPERDREQGQSSRQR